MASGGPQEGVSALSLEATKPRMAGPEGTQGQKESEDNIQLTSLVAGPVPPSSDQRV